MMRVWFAIAMVLLLSGCFTQRLEERPDRSEAYVQALMQEYRALSMERRAFSDFFDAEYFARKGLHASENESVFIESPRAWQLPKDSHPVFVEAYRRLRAVFTPAMIQKAPKELAHAQVMYECWLERVEAKRSEAEIAICRDGFEQAMKGKALRRKGKAGGTTSSPADEMSHVIYFDFDDARVKERAKQTLSNAAKDINARKVQKVQVYGHTDRAGTRAYNQGLSERRAKSVAKELQEEGVESSSIESKGFGETQPAYPTEDGVKEQRNRRVEIRVPNAPR